MQEGGEAEGVIAPGGVNRHMTAKRVRADDVLAEVKTVDVGLEEDEMGEHWAAGIDLPRADQEDIAQAIGERASAKTVVDEDRGRGHIVVMQFVKKSPDVLLVKQRGLLVL